VDKKYEKYLKKTTREKTIMGKFYFFCIADRINVSNWQEWVSGRGARSAYKVDHGASARICDQEYVEILTGAWRRVISRMATKFLKTEERAPSRRTLVLVRRNVRESQIKNWCVAVRTEVFYCKIFGDRIAGSDEQSSR
jgi:hypothetical protein